MASLGNHFIHSNDLIKTNEKFVFSGTNFRISVLSDRLIRLEYSLNGSFCDNPTLLARNRKFPDPTIKVEQDDKYLVITTKYFMLQYIKNKPFLGPKYAPDNNLKVSLLNTDKFWYYGHAEARNFQGGAISLDNFRGKVNLDKGLYSTDGFVLIDDSGTLEINSDGSLKKPDPNKVDLYLFMYKRDFALCLKDYFTLTGYPELLPRYALGIWWNREKIYSDTDSLNLVNMFNKESIPLSVLLLSEFWHIKDKQNYNLYRSGYTFNKELFKNPSEFIKELHQKNVKIGLNIDPVEGIRKEEESFNDFLNELNLLGTDNIPFNALDKDFMASYVKLLIDPLMNLGTDVFWIDYKKDLQGIQVLNYYYNENFKRDLNKRFLTITRSPIIAPHQAGILYSGETYVSWDTLKYLPFYNTLAANKGVSWWSHDVGGYKEGIEDAQLYLRYVEFSTFSPIFRFSAKRGNYYKREPWSWDVKTFNVTKSYCLLRERLIPYLYTENYNYHKYGKPLIEPIYYSYPEVYDEPIYKSEYFFGKEFFIAPITKPKDAVMNRSIERIFLPKGVWYDFKTGKKFIGDKRYVTFYKEEDYPVFVRAGGIIPLANLTNDINDYNPPRSMEIDVFPGESNKYVLYEDDGVSKNYQNGYFIKTAIEYNYMQNNYTLIIRPIEGKTKIIPDLRDYKIRFRNTKNADDVSVYLNGDKDTLNYTKYVDENDFVIEVKDVDTTKQLTINCKGKDIEINAVRIINEDINSIISDLSITTRLKEELASIFFSDMDIRLKRIRIKKLKGLDKRFVKMFIKLLEYIAEI